MVRSLIILVLALAGMGLLGCVTSQFMPVGGQTFAPRPDDYLIDIYIPGSAPVVVHQQLANAKPVEALPAGARVIGRIDTQGAPAAGWAAVFEDAKRKARTLGGDAVVVRQWGNPLVAIDSYGGAMHGKAISLEVVRLKP
ncbi:MAG: hypothetical protein HYX51_00935 [Chloroflexi bacterium]|nr:hypothetical protein [Chloroflexota bacterium]